jgi:hypothetical protein
MTSHKHKHDSLKTEVHRCLTNAAECQYEFVRVFYDSKWISSGLEAQWAEPVSLTFHSALRKLNTEPYIGASHQISIHLAKQFQRRRLRSSIGIAHSVLIC